MLKEASTTVPAVLRQAFPDARILVAIPAFNEGPTIASVVLKADVRPRGKASARLRDRGFGKERPPDGFPKWLPRVLKPGPHIPRADRGRSGDRIATASRSSREEPPNR